MIEAPGFLKFLIIGSDTQVGASLCQYLAERRIPYESIESGTITDNSVIIQWLEGRSQPYVVNALYEEPLNAGDSNVQHWLNLAESIALHCDQAGSTLIQISSAIVYSGTSSRPYNESDEPDASSALGKSLNQLELAVQTLAPRTIVLRTSWLFSKSADNMLARLVDVATRRESLQVSGKLRGCPTDANVVAKVIVAMCEQVDCSAEPNLWGIYHYVDSDACSMHRFAKTVITVVKSMAEVKVEAIVEVDNDSSDDTILEPENYELNCKKILSTFGIKQRPWRRGVQDVLNLKFSSTDS